MKKSADKKKKSMISKIKEDYPPEPLTGQVRVDGGCQEAGIDTTDFERRFKDFNVKIEPREFQYPHNNYRRVFDPEQLLRKFRCIPRWNSVLLFFNLADTVQKPGDYQLTTVQDALEFQDEGAQPADVPITQFMNQYWCVLSYGYLAFSINTPRDGANQPLIPTISPTGGANAWGESIKLCIEAHAQQVWEAAGSLMLDGKRWIPSVVLVQRFNVGISATFGPRSLTIGGVEYEIGDQHHMHYNLGWANPGGTAGTSAAGRMIWGRMCHEYAHNFLEFGDLYGPTGCTGYWDLLGDNSPSTRMSEVCSFIKEHAGWLQFKQVIEGPTFPQTLLKLKPYTTSGEAFKIVPSPEMNPHECFLLEYRKSTGNEIWRPDGGLTQEGLLITHINTRMLRGGNSPAGIIFLRDAPFYDPEFADFADNGGTLWTGALRLDGVLYPQPGKNSFTPTTSPNSNFYGQVPSGLHITNIQVVGGELQFNLQIANNLQHGWTVTGAERGLAGHFIDDPIGGTDQIFFRDADHAALLVHRQAQWLVKKKQDDWIGEWNLGADNYEVIGDLDGDGYDEVYMRSPNWAGVLKWQYGRFQSVTVQFDWIDQWNLGSDNTELAADVDGDGADEIFIRSPQWAGIIKLINGRLYLRSIQHDWIDQWNMGPGDQHWRGRFTQTNRDEILIRSGQWMGLLEWDAAQQKLRLRSIQYDWIDQWNMGPGDRHTIGDFDGDGLDEIYIRSNHWAGVLKWNGNRFQLLWIGYLTLNPWDGNIENAIDLHANDTSYAGRFLDDRDGILHRYAEGMAILHWRNNEMQVRHKGRSPLNGRWNLAGGDKFVLGKFIRGGPDTGNPAITIIEPGLTGIFLHNGWGTGSVGVNYHRENVNTIRENFGLYWIQSSTLLLSG